MKLTIPGCLCEDPFDPVSFPSKVTSGRTAHLVVGFNKEIMVVWEPPDREFLKLELFLKEIRPLEASKVTRKGVQKATPISHCVGWWLARVGIAEITVSWVILGVRKQGPKRA